MTRPRARAALAALLSAGAVAGIAGCGGGGGDDAPAAAAPAPVASLPAQVPPGDGAASAVAGLGYLQPVDEAALDRQLDGFETLGGPHDPFRQQDQGGAEAAETPVDASATDAEASADAAAVPAAPEVPLGGAPVTAPTVPAPAAVAVPPITPVAPPATTPAAAGAPEASTASAPAADESATPAKRGDAPLALVADLDVSGDAISGSEGDLMPPDTRWFTLQSVDAGRVVLRLEGALLPGGEDTVTLRVGESVTLRAAGGATRRITLIRVRSA